MSLNWKMTEGPDRPVPDGECPVCWGAEVEDWSGWGEVQCGRCGKQFDPPRPTPDRS